MKTRLLVFAAALALGAASALADIAGPGFRPGGGDPLDRQPVVVEPETSQAMPLEVVIDPAIIQPTLRIPQSLLDSDGAVTGRRAGTRDLRTIFAGLAISVAVAGAVIVSRRSRRPGPIVAGIVAVAVLAGAGSVVLGNAAPPLVTDDPDPAGPLGQLDDVRVEVVPDGDAIELVVPDADRLYQLLAPALDESVPGIPAVIIPEVEAVE